MAQLPENVLDRISDGFYTLDRDWRFTYLNHQACVLLQHPSHELLGKNVWDEFPDAAEMVFHEAFQRAMRDNVPVSFEALYPRLGGWFELRVHPSDDGLAVLFQDINARKISEERIRFQAHLLNIVEQAVIATDRDGVVVFWNRFAESLYGWTADEAVGQNVSELTVPESERGTLTRILDQLARGISWSGDEIARRRDGTRFLAYFAGSPVFGEDGQIVGFVSVSSDITDRKQLEAQLVHAALHDTLTDLPNRAYFFDQTRRAMDAARQRTGTIAVLFLDLDDFKDINDRFGHECGDALLVQVAIVLQDCVDEGSTVFRLGGDEFVILMEDIVEIDTPVSVADRVLAALGQPLELAGHHVSVSASIGVVASAERHTQPEDLLRDADIAMYRAKDAGKNRLIVFEAAMHAEVTERLELESALREALDRNEFFLHYQPTILLATGKVVGVEALLRWRHPERGIIPPSIFIPLAERTGLIIPLGMWALREACLQGVKWCQAYLGPDPFNVSVNLTSHQFAQANLVDQIRAVLEETGLPAACLALEITESTAMDDARTTVGRLHDLKALSIQLGVDDFGTGYSSLAYLKRFPLDVLKIDRSFVNGLGRVSEDTAIVSATITLAHAIGLGVVAEGVETPEQAQLLRDLGCERAQGFYFSPPVPGNKISELLHRDARLGEDPESIHN